LHDLVVESADPRAAGIIKAEAGDGLRDRRELA
jgi:hypothetical protein